ncbi:MAG TPA: Ig-like domain repeat protein [Verrucomicrobiota bacterium]|nr:Ig-like domain repeat protein [Verrucomicrobiota bacterium]HQL79394.1 Ig-like domain repeat protein [Verrucomicrobiota bacterium]
MKPNSVCNLGLPPRARAFQFAAVGVLITLATVSFLPAATVTLRQGLYGYTGAADAWLDESSKNDNYGGCPYVRIQYNDGMSDCALVQFALPSLSYQSLTSATLGLYYYDQSSMTTDNALWITPYRITNGMSWYENTYNGVSGHGVNWKYRDDAQSLPWTLQSAAWYDKIDDGNPLRKIKKEGGSVPDAIAPPAWVTWNVLNSIAQWYGGQQNNGLVLYESGFEGTGSILAGLFSSRENGLSDYNPYLAIAYSGAGISWSGASSAAWDSASYNWNVGGCLGTYGDGDFVTFADGASNPAITVTGGGVAPGSVTINNAATTYSFSGGSINGSGTLTKQGAGQATLLAGNGYSGLTLVKAGALIVAANNALGATGSGTVVSNGAALGFQGSVNYSSAEAVTISGGGGGGGGGALYAVSGNNIFAGPVTLAANSTVGVAASLGLTLNGAITGNFSFTKTGGGQLSLSGTSANTYSGATYINGGTLVLRVSATIPNSPVIAVGGGATLDVATVMGGFSLGATVAQTLKGSGTVSGNVAAKALARLEPGDSPGTLTFLNDLTLAAGVTNYFELTNSLAIGGGTNDLMIIEGDLALNDNVIAIAVLGAEPLGAGSYRLINYAGAKTGSFNPTPVFLSGGPAPGSTVWIDESQPNEVNLVVVTPVSTVTSVSAMPNPSLPGENVTLTATVTPLNPGTNGAPTGSVTFQTNGVPLGPPVPLDNGVAILSTAGLAHGLSTVWAEYPGNGQFLGSTGNVVHLVNTPPIPGCHVVYVLKNEELSLPVAALLAGDHDRDGDPLNITQVSELSTNGGTAALIGTGKLAFLPKPDYVGSDLLTYTVADPYTNVTVPIYIHVLAGDDLANSIVGITNQGGGAVTLTATGIPGWPYQVQSVSNLNFPLFWRTLSTNIAGTNGLFRFTDPGATNAEGYYRTVTSTNPPEYQMYDAELLQLETTGGGTMIGPMLRESPVLSSPGATRIELQISGLTTISSFFDVFTEVSLDHGLTWRPATNGPIPLILVGGTPLNQFPNENLPPLAGQYISPPEWPELYPPGVLIKNLTLHGFTDTFPPPAPGEVVDYHFQAVLDFWVSLDGGQLFQPYSVPAKVLMQITGRLIAEAPGGPGTPKAGP